MAGEDQNNLYSGFILTFEPERTAWLAEKLFAGTKFQLKESFSALDSTFEQRELVLLVLSQDPMSIASIAIMERMHGSGGSGKLKMRMPKSVTFEKPVIFEEFELVNPNEYLCTPETIIRTSPAAWHSLLHELKVLRPTYAAAIDELVSSREIKHLILGDDLRALRLNEERDALGLSLSIAQMPRLKVLGNINATEANKANTILDLLDNSIPVHERSIIEHDQRILELLIGETSYRHAVFGGENNRAVRVYVTDKTNIETVIGTDLLIYNTCYENFILIQYKAMEKVASGWWYLPDRQLRQQLTAMVNFKTAAKALPLTAPTMWSYRLNEEPFYFKFCERIRPRARDDSLMPGITMCETHLVEFMDLPQARKVGGNIAIGYDNCPRYLNNTEFIQLASAGWIGAGRQTGELIKKVLESGMNGGRRAMLAVLDIPKIQAADERPKAGNED